MEERRRILIVADSRSPLDRERGFAGLKGGYQIYWYRFLKVDSSDLIGTVKPYGGRAERLSFLLSPFFLVRAIREIRPHLIHVFYAYHQLNNLVLRRFKPLVVTVMGGDILSEQSFHGIKKWLTMKILEEADIITSKSDFLDRILQEIGSLDHKIRRVTWGVDTRRFCPGMDVRFLRERFSMGPDDLVFFSPRNCRPFYRQDLIIKAFALYQSLDKGKKRARLVIAELFPDESYANRLRALVKELGLQHEVHFVGPIPHQEMPLYYNLADIMVAIPPSDGMPQSLYEAMACGSYPILGNLPQYHEMIQDGVNGRLIRTDDATALAEAMGWAADSSERRRAAANVNRSKIFEVANKEVQESQVNSIYGELLKKSSF